MAKSPSRPKIGYPALALLDWLCEKGPDARIFAGGEHGVYLYEVQPPGPDGKRKLVRAWPVSGPLERNPEAQALLDRLGGRATIDYHALYTSKFIRGYNGLGHVGTDRAQARRNYEAFVARLDKDYFHFSQTAYVLTREGYEFWKDKGRAMAAEARARRDAERAATARTVLIGRPATIRPRLPAELAKRIPKDLHLPLPSRRIVAPYATATVVRTTPTRLYVRDVETLPATESFGERPIGGSFPHQFVSPEAVMVDDCSPRLAVRLAEITAEFQAEADAIGTRIVEEMLPKLIDLDSRLKQKDAERADAVAEALREAGKQVPDLPDEASGPKGP